MSVGPQWRLCPIQIGRNPNMEDLLLLFYAIATNSGGHMMYEMRRRKPEPTLLLTQLIFNLPYHMSMVREELAFDDAVSYMYPYSFSCV